MTYLLDTCLISKLVAIALQHSLHLVTRNENDFAGTGVAIVNPWSA
jgi:toxin FitB